VQAGYHNPHSAHVRVHDMYNWARTAARTEQVYEYITTLPERTLLDRLKRDLRLGTFAGPIFVMIAIVQCYFFAFLEWLVPRSQLDYVDDEWDRERFSNICSRETRDPL